MRGSLPVLSLVLLVACPAPGADSHSPCVPPFAVFTDIDETLTTTDEEWLAQLGDPTHDPAMRPGADALMQGYAERGYTVFYVTARGERLALSDGRGARQASEDWLIAHGFPYADGQLYLAEGLGALGDSAVAYKSEVIMDLEAEGWQADWAYGNADTDILAFQDAGLPDEHIFLVGELAGTMGVQPIPDEEAYEAHQATQLPQVSEQGCD